MWIKIHDYRAPHAFIYNRYQDDTLFRGVRGLNPTLRSLYLFLSSTHQLAHYPRLLSTFVTTLSPPAHLLPAPLSHETLASTTLPQLLAQLMTEGITQTALDHWQHYLSECWPPDSCPQTSPQNIRISWQDEAFEYRLHCQAHQIGEIQVIPRPAAMAAYYDTHQGGWMIRWGEHERFYPGSDPFPWDRWQSDALHLWFQHWRTHWPAPHFIPADRAAQYPHINAKVTLWQSLGSHRQERTIPQVPRTVSDFYTRLRQLAEQSNSADAPRPAGLIPGGGRLFWHPPLRQWHYQPNQHLRPEPFHPTSVLPWDAYLLMAYLQWLPLAPQLLLIEEPDQGVPPGMLNRFIRGLLHTQPPRQMLLSSHSATYERISQQLMREGHRKSHSIRIFHQGTPTRKRCTYPGLRSRPSQALSLFDAVE